MRLHKTIPSILLNISRTALIVRVKGAKGCGISFSSARRWLSLLESTRIVYLLRPYTGNSNKRVIKSPKLYFTDTGLLSYILRYQDAETLRSGPMCGAIFENFLDFGSSKKLFEIKSCLTPRPGHFQTLSKLIRQFEGAEGYLVTLSDRTDNIAEKIKLLPWKNITSFLSPR